MKTSSLKPCKEHERRWRDLCVDNNLEDDWLERLNKLKAFILVGICEGHSYNSIGSTGRYPHLNFSLKKSLLEGIAGDWENLRIAMLNETGKLFRSDNTNIRLELSFRLRAGQGKFVYHEDMKMKVMSYQARNTVEMGAETRGWFISLIDQIEGIDRAVYEWHERRQGT